jgi:vWA-MoxR associated protein C-terminal domain
LSASGAPFACWHNSGFKGAAADIPALLGQTILEELPHALRKARLDRNGLKDLTLLYDDPQRDPYQNES